VHQALLGCAAGVIGWHRCTGSSAVLVEALGYNRPVTLPDCDPHQDPSQDNVVG
jgi:hypothetical protein